MTTTGPWIQPPDETLTADYLPLRVSERSGTGFDAGYTLPFSQADRDDHADAILEGNAYGAGGAWGDGAGWSASGAVLNAASDPNPDYLDFPSSSLLTFWVVRFADLYMPQTTTSPVPDGVVGAEFEEPGGVILTANLTAAVRVGATTGIPSGGVRVPTAVATTGFVLLPTALQYTDDLSGVLPVGPTGNTGVPWWAPSDISAMPVALAVGAGAVDETFADLDIDLDTNRPSAVIVAATARQRSGAPAPFDGVEEFVQVWSQDWFTTGTGDRDGYQPGPLLTYTYRPPRFRWVFAEAPPQRRYPRDDGLSASTLRSWPARSSRQRGPRRGGDATYL